MGRGKTIVNQAEVMGKEQALTIRKASNTSLDFTVEVTSRPKDFSHNEIETLKFTVRNGFKAQVS